MVGCEISPWSADFLTLDSIAMNILVRTVLFDSRTVNYQLSTVNCYIFRIIPHLPLLHRWDKQM